MADTDAAPAPEEAHPILGLLVGLLVTAVGAGFIGLTSWVFVDNLNFVQRSVPATGVIVEMVDDGDDNSFPIVEFTPALAREPVRFRGNVSGGSVGESVEVHYLAKEPTQARIEQRGSTAVLMIAGLILGGMVLVFGVLILIFVFYWGPRDRRRRRLAA